MLLGLKPGASLDETRGQHLTPRSDNEAKQQQQQQPSQHAQPSKLHPGSHRHDQQQGSFVQAQLRWRDAQKVQDQQQQQQPMSPTLLSALLNSPPCSSLPRAILTGFQSPPPALTRQQQQGGGSAPRSSFTSMSLSPSSLEKTLLSEVAADLGGGHSNLGGGNSNLGGGNSDTIAAAWRLLGSPPGGKGLGEEGCASRGVRRSKVFSLPVSLLDFGLEDGMACSGGEEGKSFKLSNTLSGPMRAAWRRRPSTPCCLRTGAPGALRHSVPCQGPLEYPAVCFLSPPPLKQLVDPEAEYLLTPRYQDGGAARLPPPYTLAHSQPQQPPAPPHDFAAPLQQPQRPQQQQLHHTPLQQRQQQQQYSQQHSQQQDPLHQTPTPQQQLQLQRQYNQQQQAPLARSQPQHFSRLVLPPPRPLVLPHGIVIPGPGPGPGPGAGPGGEGLVVGLGDHQAREALASPVQSEGQPSPYPSPGSSIYSQLLLSPTFNAIAGYSTPASQRTSPAATARPPLARQPSLQAGGTPAAVVAQRHCSSQGASPSHTADTANGWSEVPALSWGDWKSRHQGFGILSTAVNAVQPEGGTPDNGKCVPRGRGGAAGRAGSRGPTRSGRSSSGGGSPGAGRIATPSRDSYLMSLRQPAIDGESFPHSAAALASPPGSRYTSQPQPTPAHPNHPSSPAYTNPIQAAVAAAVAAGTARHTDHHLTPHNEHQRMQQDVSQVTPSGTAAQQQQQQRQQQQRQVEQWDCTDNGAIRSTQTPAARAGGAPGADGSVDADYSQNSARPSGTRLRRMSAPATRRNDLCSSDDDGDEDAPLGAERKHNNNHGAPAGQNQGSPASRAARRLDSHFAWQGAGFPVSSQPRRHTGAGSDHSSFKPVPLPLRLQQAAAELDAGHGVLAHHGHQQYAGGQQGVGSGVYAGVGVGIGGGGQAACGASRQGGRILCSPSKKLRVEPQGVVRQSQVSEGGSTPKGGWSGAGSPVPAAAMPSRRPLFGDGGFPQPSNAPPCLRGPSAQERTLTAHDRSLSLPISIANSSATKPSYHHPHPTRPHHASSCDGTPPTQLWSAAAATTTANSNSNINSNAAAGPPVIHGSSLPSLLGLFRHSSGGATAPPDEALLRKQCSPSRQQPAAVPESQQLQRTASGPRSEASATSGRSSFEAAAAAPAAAAAAAAAAPQLLPSTWLEGSPRNRVWLNGSPPFATRVTKPTSHILSLSYQSPAAQVPLHQNQHQQHVPSQPYPQPQNASGQQNAYMQPYLQQQQQFQQQQQQYQQQQQQPSCGVAFPSAENSQPHSDTISHAPPLHSCQQTITHGSSNNSSAPETPAYLTSMFPDNDFPLSAAPEQLPLSRPAAAEIPLQALQMLQQQEQQQLQAQKLMLLQLQQHSQQLQQQQQQCHTTSTMIMTVHQSMPPSQPLGSKENRFRGKRASKPGEAEVGGSSGTTFAAATTMAATAGFDAAAGRTTPTAAAAAAGGVTRLSDAAPNRPGAPDPAVSYQQASAPTPGLTSPPSTATDTSTGAATTTHLGGPSHLTAPATPSHPPLTDGALAHGAIAEGAARLVSAGTAVVRVPGERDACGWPGEEAPDAGSMAISGPPSPMDMGL
ncbi:MAG: hypothetical protein WDW38_004279 [Sanguina aurantia]